MIVIIYKSIKHKLKYVYKIIKSIIYFPKENKEITILNKQIERELKKSQQLNQDILDSLDEHIAVINNNGEIIATNKAWDNFARENDSKPEAVGIGVNYLKVCRNAAKSGYSDAQIALDGIQAIIDGDEESFSFEYSIHLPKEKRWFILYANAINNNKGVVLSYIDISKRKEEEELLIMKQKELEEVKIKNLEEQKEMFEDIFNAVSVGIMLIGQDFKVKHINQPLLKIKENLPGDFLDQAVGAAFNCCYFFDYVESCGQAKECSTCRIRTAVETTFRSGKAIRNLETVATIKMNGQFISRVLKINTVRIAIGDCYYVVLSMEDITKSKEYQERINTALKKADYANEEKSKFLAKMSHEIRTPMNGIIGMTDLVLTTKLSIEQKEYIDLVKMSADNLLTVVNSILDYSKIEAGKMELEKKEFLLDEVIKKTIKILSVEAEEKGLEIIYKPGEKLPGACMGDPIRIQQIFFNLIGNAIKFTNKGSVTIEKEVIEVIKDNTNKNFISFNFRITDTGIGIEAEKLDHLFESYKQLNSSKYKGTGLGLVISQQLVEMMGGTIEVESEVNKGTTLSFKIELEYLSKENTYNEFLKNSSQNLSESDLLQVDAKISSLNYKSRDEYKKVKILIAEDNQINQKLISAYLLKKGLQYTIVNNGKEAYDEYLSGNYDLILLDIIMPEIDGFELTRMIKGTEAKEKKNTPIIALTASAMEEDRKRCFEAGMDDYISKPIKQDDFFSTIDKHLNKSYYLHVDINKISKVMLEDIDLFQEILAKFSEIYPLTIEELYQANDHREYQELAKKVHKFKGTVLNFGAVRAISILKNMEGNLSTGSHKNLKQDISQLEKEMEVVEAILLKIKEDLTYENFSAGR